MRQPDKHVRFFRSAPLAVPVVMASAAAEHVVRVRPSDGPLQAAIDRLAAYYNDYPYDPVTNPGGFAGGGHRVNFVRALQDVALVVHEAGKAQESAA